MTEKVKNAKPQQGLTRRKLLKGSAAAVGVAAGSGVITGFPTVWAQNIKDITLNHTGMSYSTLIDIARQATKDLGFTVEMSVTDHPGSPTAWSTIRSRSMWPTARSGRPRSTCRSV